MLKSFIEQGSLTLYTAATNETFVMNAFGSCNPSSVGCDLCTTSGFQERLPDAIGDFEDSNGFAGDNYEYTWTVTCASEESCGLSAQLGLTYTVDRSMLDVEESPYEITFEISRESDEKVFRAASVLVNVLNGVDIEAGCNLVQVSVDSEKATPSEDPETGAQILVINKEFRSNLLFAKVENVDDTALSTAEVNLEWSFLGEVVSVDSFLAITAELLSLGTAPYTFTLWARQDCTGGNDPYGELVLRLNNPPVNGTVVVSPTNGTIETTVGFL